MLPSFHLFGKQTKNRHQKKSKSSFFDGETTPINSTKHFDYGACVTSDGSSFFVESNQPKHKKDDNQVTDGFQHFKC